MQHIIFAGKATHPYCMPLYLISACLLLPYMYECSLDNLLMEKNKHKERRKVFALCEHSQFAFIMFSIVCYV